jgi:hypothetical protein
MENKRTSAQMVRLVTQWRQSGESQASFARRHRIPGWRFWYWCRKLSDEPRPEVADASAFVPERWRSSAPAHEPIRRRSGAVCVTAFRKQPVSDARWPIQLDGQSLRRRLRCGRVSTSRSNSIRLIIDFISPHHVQNPSQPAPPLRL